MARLASSGRACLVHAVLALAGTPRSKPCSCALILFEFPAPDPPFPTYVCCTGKGLHWIEFGVGGGTSANGDQKATTAEEAAFTPFFGERTQRQWYTTWARGRHPLAVSTILAHLLPKSPMPSGCTALPHCVFNPRPSACCPPTRRRGRALHPCQGPVRAVRSQPAVPRARLRPALLQCHRAGRQGSGLLGACLQLCSCVPAVAGSKGCTP